MSDVAISVENLSKSYLIGHQRSRREPYVVLRDVIAREAGNFARKGLDFLRGRQIVQGDEIEEFWALREVSFDVRRGEVLGIIGRNGAGKSTLLKILSRITEPCSGRAILRGRVASLLEVGTGFHGELTGRENIFLNGAILGMRKAEIQSKLDEIVAFSEVEKFLDTPVKRYSSGMYVRLAFSVAAHLEPEILILDEVLAVGDSEFQKKCLGKMGQVARDGRTVLFVSHNISAVEALCDRAVILDQGRAQAIGEANAIASKYLKMFATDKLVQGELASLRRSGRGRVTFDRIEFQDRFGNTITNPVTGDELNIVMSFSGTSTERQTSRVGITFYDSNEVPLFLCGSELVSNTPLEVGAGDIIACRIPRLPLGGGAYKLGLFLERKGVVEDWLREELISIAVADSTFYGTPRNLPAGWEGKVVLVEHDWSHFQSVNHRPNDVLSGLR